MSFYPTLNEFLKESTSNTTTKRVSKFFVESLIIDKLHKKYPEKYGLPKNDTIKQIINNKIGVSNEEFEFDVKDILSNKNVIKNIVDVLNKFELDDKSFNFVFSRQDGGISDTYPTLIFKLNGEDKKIKFSGYLIGENGTPTIFKEGMVVYFFQSEYDYKPFSTNDVDEYHIFMNKIIHDFEEQNFDGIEIIDMDKILDVLKSKKSKLNTSFLNSIFTALSIANKLKKTKFKTWEIHKDKYFDKLKSDAAIDLGFKSNAIDKWNPMDLILIKPNSKNEIEKIWKEAKDYKDQESKLATYNSIFVNDLNSTNDDELIFAVSLKESISRSGRAKSFLSEGIHKKQKDQYDILPEEKKWSENKLKSEIINLRTEIYDMIYKNGLDEYFNYKIQDRINVKQDITSLFSKFKGDNKSSIIKKYGALKLVKYLMNHVSHESNIFVDLASYGMSLGKNPTFFKYVGSKDGNDFNVKTIKYEALGGVILHSDDSTTPKIEIYDSNQANSIDISYDIQIGNVINKLKLDIRMSNESQIGIEIKGLK